MNTGQPRWKRVTAIILLWCITPVVIPFKWLHHHGIAESHCGKELHESGKISLKEVKCTFADQQIYVDEEYTLCTLCKFLQSKKWDAISDEISPAPCLDLKVSLISGFSGLIVPATFSSQITGRSPPV